MPFDLFPRQVDYLRWLDARVEGREEGVVEKSRDVGVTYLTAGYALHKWLFQPGFLSAFGSRVEDDVDRLGNPSTIFEKMRMILRALPAWMKPEGYSEGAHALFMRLINPQNGNIISGQSGDNMGRGTRFSLYVVDEGAFIERAEKVEAAIVAVADCRIWASSVNGPGNVFARKAMSGAVPVFRFHWRDDPRKTDEWAAKTKAALTDPVAWASEYEIDYTASIEGICIPGAWVQSALRIRDLIDVPPSKVGVAGQDVGAGKAKSVFIPRHGPVVGMPQAWRDPDTIETAHRALKAARETGCTLLNYDPVGVGRGVTDALSRADHRDLRVSPVNVGVPPSDAVWPDGRTAEEMFANLKAEIWWRMREAFQRTHERLLWEEGRDGGIEHPVDELIALTLEQNLVAQLSTVRWFRNEKGKIMIETKDQLKRRGVQSPDYAEALVLTFAPEPEEARMVKIIGL